MTSNLLYVLGTLAQWIAGIGLLGVAFAFAKGLAESHRGPGRFRSLGGWIGISAFGLLAATAVPLEMRTAAGWRFPLVWLVMPFSAWLGVAGAIFGTFALAQSLMAVGDAERGRRRRSAWVWLAVSGGAWTWFGASRESVEVLRGSVAVAAQAAGAILLLFLFAIFVTAYVSRSAAARGVAKKVANHAALLAGSVVFGLPFAWLLITSFKEDRDMSSPTGLVWIPRVQERVPYFDPEDPLVEGRYEGEPAEGRIIERLADGSARVEIERPAVLRGLTFLAKPPLKIVPRQVPVVEADFRGERIRGRVVKNLEDGGYRVEVLSPPTLKGERFEAKPEAVTLVRPIGLKWMNYPEALDYLPRETNKGLVYLRNTLVIVILSVIGTLLSSSIVAYAFARLRFPGRNALFLVLLSTMMLPAAVTLIPQFLIFRWLGWIDTLRPLWFTAFLGSAFNIFLLRQFFLGIPMELEDAAKIDGCSYPRTFWQVMLPQIKPALAVVAIWTFMGAWNNFMGPLIYINSPENMPIAYAVQLFQGDRTAEPGLLMAFATMSMLPVLLVFFFAQKYFIEGVTLSGLGGR